MTKPWNYEPTDGKLVFFVSSRIAECKEERAAARAGIESTNHRAVLFEHVGARPYPARDLYLSHLADSDGMIAIYKDGYGYVDTQNGMSISGLEDEYRFAMDRGIEVLAYVFHDATNRDPKLSEILAQAAGPLTLYPYREPIEIETRVREDLTALITRRVRKAQIAQAVAQESAGNIIGRLTARLGFVVDRVKALDDLESELHQYSLISVVGAPGSGKTTLAAQLAVRLGCAFVRLTGLSPKEIFAACAGALRQRADIIFGGGLQAARNAFCAAWVETLPITLIVDECAFPDELLAAIKDAGGASVREKTLVLTSRTLIAGTFEYAVPPLSADEVGAIEGHSSRSLAPDALRRSQGLPLRLQQEIAGAAPTVSDLEAASDNELVSYLALSEVPLSADDLLALKGGDESKISAIYEELGKVPSIVEDTPRGFSLVHSAFSEPIRLALRRKPQRFAFYARRLISHFKTIGEWRLAYAISVELDDGSAESVAGAALQEAARLGDWRTGVALAERLYATARDQESKAQAFRHALSLVYPLELMGETAQASAFMLEAKELAAELGEEAQGEFEFAQASGRARKSLGVAEVAELEKLHEKFRSEGSEWQQARAAIDLSVLYMHARDFERSVGILRSARKIFEELGDDVGVEISTRNLASCLEALPGNEEEADALIAEVKARYGGKADTRRQKAWINNILSRRYRRAGRYEDAEKVSREACEIAEELGDQELRATNLINLGNALRDQERLEEALAAYSEAANIAQKCGRRDQEGDASRLAATILNDEGSAAIHPDRFERAKHFAEHAHALLQNTRNFEAAAQASRELADALVGLGEKREAALAYFRAAREYALANEDQGELAGFDAGATLALEIDDRLYIEQLAEFLSVPAPSTRDPLESQFLALMPTIMRRASRGILSYLLGFHLHTLTSHLARPVHIEVISQLIDAIGDLNRQSDGETWRGLYASIVGAALLSRTPQHFLQSRLAGAAVANRRNIFVRERGEGSRVWTVTVDLGRLVTITISPLDDSPASNLAAMSLALFVRAFGEQWNAEIVRGASQISEIDVQVALYDEMPPDLQETMDSASDGEGSLNDVECSVTRPVEYGQDTTTFVLLGKPFLESAKIGVGKGGALQYLFGATLMELTRQVFQGEIEADDLRPKIVSLVRQTMS